MEIPTRKHIRDKLVSAAAKAQYKPWKYIDGCAIEFTKLEASASDKSSALHVYRVTTDMNCSLASFRALITTHKNTALYDPSLESLKTTYADNNTAATCVHAKYKAVSVVSARDYCSWQCYDTLSWEAMTPREQQMVVNLSALSISGGTPSSSSPASKDKLGNQMSAQQCPPKEVFIHSSIDSNLAPQTPNLIRGVIHVFGYVAFPLTAPPSSSAIEQLQHQQQRIRVSMIVCVDPKGNIPAFALDGANADNAKKLAKIKEMTELIYNIADNMGMVFPFPPGDLKGQEKLMEGQVEEGGAPSKSNEKGEGDENKGKNSNGCGVEPTDFDIIDDEEATASRITKNGSTPTPVTQDPTATTDKDIKSESALEMVDEVGTAADDDDNDDVNEDEADSYNDDEISENIAKKPTCDTIALNDGNNNNKNKNKCSDECDDDDDGFRSVQGTATVFSESEVSRYSPSPNTLPSSPNTQIEATAGVSTDVGVAAAATAVTTTAATAPAAPIATAKMKVNEPQPTPVPEKLRFDESRLPHFERILELHRATPWNASKTLDNCLLEDAKVPFSHIKATRISTDFRCSVESFSRYMGDVTNQRFYDPKMEVFEMIKEGTEPAKGVITYSSYKRETRWISPRDFCCHSASFMVTDAGELQRLGFPSDVKKAYVSSTCSIDGIKPLEKNWVRGIIHVFGYVVTATSLTADRCKVYNIACVDPAGSLPGAVMDAMSVDNCKKLALIRKLCEESHNNGPAELIGVVPPAAAVIASAGSSETKQQGESSSAKGASSPTTKTAAATAAVKNNTDDTDSREEGCDNDNDDCDDGDGDSSSDTSFESCLDEVEVHREAADLKEFYAAEVNAICRRLTALHCFKGWTLLATKDDARVETVLTPLSTKKAVRVSVEAECSLEDFWTIISNVQYTRRYDPNIDHLEMLQSPPYGSVTYTSYRGGHGVEPRDFCTMTASKFLTEREGSDAHLYTEGIHSSALVVNSIDCDDYPPQEGIVRGAVYAHGFIAIATPPAARRIRIFHIVLIDPKGADVPAKYEDAAAHGLADKVIAIARLAEAQGRGTLKTFVTASEKQLSPPTVAGTKSPAKSPALTAAAAPSTTAVHGSALVLEEKSGDSLVRLMRRPSMADIDEDVYLSELLRNQTHLHWVGGINIGAATADAAQLLIPPSDTFEKGRSLTIVRITMELQCSLATFEAVVNNADNRRKYEPEIDILQYHEGPPNATLTTCCYKKDKGLSMGGYALNSVTVSRRLRHEEIEAFRLVTSCMHAAVYAESTIGWDDIEVPQALLDEGFVKANVYTNGYIATAIPPDALRVRVSHQWCVHSLTVEDGPGDASRTRHMQQEGANRMIRLAALCRATEAMKAQAFYSGTEEAANSNSRSRGLSTVSNTSAAVTPMRSRAVSSIGGGNSKEDLAVSPSANAATTSSNSFAGRPRAVSGTSSGNNNNDSFTTSGTAAPKPRTMSMAAISSSQDLRYQKLYAKLMGLVDREDWKRGAVAEGCLVETCAVEYCKFDAVRITATFGCSLETFKTFMGKEENVRKYDSTLDTFELAKKTPDSSIIYCSYKRQSMLVSPRDFVTENANIMLTPEEALSLRLTRLTDNHGAYVQTCVSTSNALRPTEGKEWVRGTIHAHGYVAVAESPRRISVQYYACVDPSGSIPKWISDATTTLSAKTLATIRMFCEEKEKKK